MFPRPSQNLFLKFRITVWGFSDQAIDENEHNGLRNIKDRASEMQAFFSIVSKLGIGTTIRIGLQLKSPLPNYATKK